MILQRFSNRLRPLLSQRFSMRQMMSTNIGTVVGCESSDKGLILINREKALNAINLQMVRKMYEFLKKWETSKSLVIIKGSGDKSFCAGGDVRAIVEAGPTEESKSFFREEYTLNALIGNYKVPFIALIDGITMGGGVGLSVHGRYRVATERTIFAMPETAIGLFPDVGGSYFLPRLNGQLGMFLGLTGYRLKGSDVLQAGIATHYCDSIKLPELEKALLDCRDNENVPDILKEICQAPPEEFVLGKNLERINSCFNAESVEEIIQNLEKDGSEWAVETLKSLNKLSPTSLKVTHREITSGAKFNLKQCLKMEYRMVVRHLIDSDFKEGVRALLIDKDKKPEWKPACLEEVTPERVQYYFDKLPDCDELKFDDINIEEVKSKI